LDDKRSENAKSSIPDCIERFSHLEQETQRERTEQSFPAPQAENRRQQIRPVCHEDYMG
jgi:type I restriction enzyme M protein